MSQNESQTLGKEAAEADTGFSFLDQAIGATTQSDRNEVEDLLKTLATQAMQGTVVWDKNLNRTIKKAIASIDEAISAQLAEIMHNEKLQNLEGSWRGLKHLVFNTSVPGVDISRLKVANSK